MTRAWLLCALLVLSCVKKAETLPQLGTVPELALVDQAGRAGSPRSVAPGPFLAAFFFTRCPSVCPRITAVMKEIQEKKDASGQALRLVSISVDPEYDTPEVLRAYAKKSGIDLSSWTLWTGPYETIARAAEEGFKIGLQGKADTSKPDLGITHGSHLILVDGAGVIRGYYRSFDDGVAERVLTDLARLTP